MTWGDIGAIFLAVVVMGSLIALRWKQWKQDKEWRKGDKKNKRG